jgi:23S rRNA pseudouridine1911/1915/1917 synthase
VDKQQIDVIYEDSDIIVVDKPAGILTHPTDKVLGGTLVNLLLHHTTLSSTGMPFRPGVVHRLDRETSGVIVFAKTDSAHESLVMQFQNRQVEKEYIAVVLGRVTPLNIRVECTVSPDKKEHTKMRVHYLRGKKAVTFIEVVKYIDNLTVVKAKPVTGRTHQIRITLAHLGYPVIGDLKYGVESDKIGRVALHSQRLALALPSTGEKVVFSAPIPEDMLTIIHERL